MTPAVAQHVKFCPACREQFPDDGLYCPNDGSPLVAKLPDDVPPKPDPYLGRTILDHIEIRELVGVGAMGRVYRAFQKGIDRDVAVKVLHRELSANAQLVGRFLREAKVASRPQHPNVVHVLLSGQLPDGALYIVMEYLHGLSLQSAIVETGAAFDLPRALHVALQLCDAVGEAHVQGIVHRDLKPENVMMVRRGQDADFVKVLDFGIARLNWSEQSMATATGLIFGTARYISPEGAQGDKVGPPGDVYSIATLTYQLLAGRTPFEGDQAVGLLIQQIHEPPPPLRSHAAAETVPPAIADVVMRGLAKDPAARYDGARSFGRALVEAARASGVAADDYYARSLFAAGPPSGQGRSSSPSDPSLPRAPAAAPHPPASSSRDLNGPPVAGPTARWTPPAAVQAELAAAALSHAKARESSPSKPALPAAGAVEATLDDDDAATAERARDARTELTTPAPLGGTMTSAPSPALAPTPTPVVLGKGGTLPLANGVAPVPAAALMTPTPTPAPRPVVVTPTPSSSDEDAPASVPSRRGSTALIVVVCFLIGVGGALGIHQSGILSRARTGTASAPGLDTHLARTRDAIEHERWDAPPGDNARELLLTGLERWPSDAKLLALRTQAKDAMVHEAVKKKGAGDLATAARLARLASEIAPDDAPARALSGEYAAALESPPSALVPPPPPPPAVSAGRAPSPGVPAAAGRVTLDVAPAKARIGQSVQFTAKTSGKSALTDVTFVVTAPGQAQGTRLVPVLEGSAFRAQFSFLEPGRYEVSFSGRDGAAPVRASRQVVVESATAAPPPQPPATAPTGSVKWL